MGPTTKIRYAGVMISHWELEGVLASPAAVVTCYMNYLCDQIKPQGIGRVVVRARGTATIIHVDGDGVEQC